ncbi:hypothetical protein ACIA5D_14920 [Actinoplanes sp. NPDC051513]|uniref:hypothetical protein n=1 Tax=Actinoplanes sp. NPDC051513 TaxID=3363908 RepID=UPI0037A54580
MTGRHWPGWWPPVGPPPPTGTGPVPLPPKLGDQDVDAAETLAAMRDEERW